MVFARARFASRCGGERSMRPHVCAAFFKRCAKMWSNRPLAAATASETHALHTPCERQFLASA
eukprot:7031730-Lingulodinium_polyedra.AAC.1